METALALVIGLAAGAMIVLLIQIRSKRRRLKNLSLLAKSLREHSDKELDHVAGYSEFEDVCRAARGLITDLHITQRQGQRGSQALQYQDVAHDFRGPLTAIKGYAETLLSAGDDLDPEQQASCLTKIVKNANELERLAKDIVQIADLDQRRGAPRTESVALVELMESIEARFTAIAQQRGVGFRADLQDHSLKVLGDYSLLLRAISNVVENALFYTPKGGGAELTVTGSDKVVSIVVEDTGVGIKPEALASVFDRFYRADSDRCRSTGGHGLGLAITRETVELHGGSIDIQSERGRGTTVAITLPRSN